MEPFTTLRAIAAPLDEINVDTNQLCPSRFNKLPYGEAYARVLLHDRRFNADGSEKPDFILNQEPFRRARILIAGRNFGIGSSRESAVFALRAFGIRAVIAPSIGDILTNNCFRNGLLPIVLPPEQTERLMRQVLQQPGAMLTVDLPAASIIGPDGALYRFEIKALRKRRLEKGLDEIAVSLEYRQAFDAFEEAYKREVPWV